MRRLDGPLDWLRTAILAAALIWALVAFGQEMVAVARGQPLGTGAPPSSWTLGSPAVESLARTLAPLDRTLPAGRRVALASDLLPAEDFFLSMWCAYLLPRHDLVRAFHQPSLPRARVLITFGAPVEELDLGAVAPRTTPLAVPGRKAPPALFLYRLAPPPPSPGASGP